MNIQFKRNVILFCGVIVLRMVLISIEVFFNYTGIALQAIYVISILSFFVAIWFVNFSLVAEFKSGVLQFVSCSALALLLTGLCVFAAAVQGTFFKLLIAGHP
ncbi:MAG: hypothetical protein BA863_12120 [Desulfovibrio sp. S3730MH75]|nr:MAG: hypothetical protein BA863_12120 [Desulfovibrio sp. S3730MH75]